MLTNVWYEVGWAAQLCKNVVSLSLSPPRTAQLKTNNPKWASPYVCVTVTLDKFSPDGSRGMFLWSELQRKVHHYNLISSGSHLVPENNFIDALIKIWRTIKYPPGETFHRSALDCHKWENLFCCSDCRWILDPLAGILDKFILKLMFNQNIYANKNK